MPKTNSTPKITPITHFWRRNSNFRLTVFNSRMFQVIALRFAAKSEPKKFLMIPFNVSVLRSGGVFHFRSDRPHVLLRKAFSKRLLAKISSSFSLKKRCRLFKQDQCFATFQILQKDFADFPKNCKY